MIRPDSWIRCAPRDLEDEGGRLEDPDGQADRFFKECDAHFASQVLETVVSMMT